MVSTQRTGSRDEWARAAGLDPQGLGYSTNVKEIKEGRLCVAISFCDRTLLLVSTLIYSYETPPLASVP